MSSPASRRFRFAPSPNGELHLGHAYSACLNQDMAHECDADLLLRLEDTDRERCRPHFEQQIFDDLQWLGVRWSPKVRKQSEHHEDYKNALHRLITLDMVYPARMSRREIRNAVDTHEASGKVWPRDPDGAPFYPGLERELLPGERQKIAQSAEPFAWRLDVNRAFKTINGTLDWTEHGGGPQGERGAISCRPDIWGDVVLARSGGYYAYHLAVVVDDALQEITDIVRGHDLFHATVLHRLLQTLLDLPEPRYTHHQLLSDGNGRKLSKSRKDLSLRALREQHDRASVLRLMSETPKI